MNQPQQATHAVTEFDYVIVGAGSAGCALASRLAEDPSVTVALLEAGPDDHHSAVSTPLGIASLVAKPNPRNYAYNTVAQAGMNGRESYQPRGRGLGGTSSINGMVYIRGHRSDYDDWAALGCDGWSYDDVLPYFRRSERNERCDGRDDDPWHGGNGPLYVSEQRSPNRYSKRFIDAAQQAGFAMNPDFNGAQQDGVGLYQVTQHDGERWSAARAFLHRGDRNDSTFSGGRSRLAVLTSTQALRIVFEGRRACGVAVLRDGVAQTIRARREVVVSGGAFNSPQLLMASGIGPAAHLREMGIAVVHDLPGVGQNLQDHVDIILNCKVNTTELLGKTLRGVLRMVPELMRYRRHRTGTLTSNVAEAGGFVKSRSDLDRPDLQLHFVIAMLGTRGAGKSVKGHGYACHVCTLQPHSVGEVRLRSADMRDAPVIDPRFLSDERDLDKLVEGVKIVRRIFSQRALADCGGRELMTEAFGPDNANTDAIRAYIRDNAGTVYHPVGTCKMGRDAMAVVDSELRVHGVQGLRVVDASIMPKVVSGNTNAPAIMIAEKAADLMKAARRASGQATAAA